MALRIGVVVLMVTALGGAAELQRSQTVAPHELAGVTPAIEWPPPPLPTRPVLIETARERHVRLVVVSDRLEQPWSIAVLPDGAALVTERPGRLRLIRHARLQSASVRGVPEVFVGGPRGLQGLMDVVLHPHFAENHWVYLTYHRRAGEGGTAVLARGTWTGDALVDVREIFDSHAVDTEASRVAFDRDGYLYMTISAPGSPTVQRSQDPGDYAGKVVRLRDDGSVPPDNPFAQRPGYLPGIYTMGHRNGHGLALNPETGELWASEQGPSGGDEVNVLRPGANYGWPFVSFGRDYRGPRISEEPVREGVESPAVVWLPSIGVTGITFYSGRAFPAWKGNLFVGGLREGGIPRTGQLDRIEFNERWEELRREPLLTDLKQRIRDVREAPNGSLYVVTAEKNGAVLRLEPVR